MQRSLTELKNEAKALGLQVKQTGKRESKDDFIKALQGHYLEQRKVTPGLVYRLSLDCMQLALNAANLDKGELDRIMDSSDYAAEEKLDGARLLVVFSPEAGFEFFGRNLSVTDYCPTDYSDKIWLGENPAGLDFSFVLDTEVVASVKEIDTKSLDRKKGVTTVTQLTATTALLALNAQDSIKIQREQGGLIINAFDCLMLKGQDLKSWPYRKRKALVDKVVEKLQAFGLPFEKVASVVEDKRAYLEEIWERGGEGVMLKPLEGSYLPTTSRPRTGWLKVKRTVSGAIGDSVEGFITGFEPGDQKRGFKDLVGALHVSVYLTGSNGERKEHLVARVANIELELRRQITVQADSGVALEPEMYGKVVEVEGQSVSGRSLRLTHPRLLRFRSDKSPDDCVVSEEMLRKLVL